LPSDALMPEMALPEAMQELLAEAAQNHSSPGKLIAQSLTQTS
jgi:hypothetical protein